MPATTVLTRIRGEYLEMPGLQLTLAQVQRLCGVEGTLCKAVLDALVDAKFLCVKPNGVYARLTDGAVPRPRPPKADVGFHAHLRAAS
jgi:hypothetical protein